MARPRAEPAERRRRRRHRGRARSAVPQLELEAVLPPRRAGLARLGARELELPRREQLAAEVDGHRLLLARCREPRDDGRQALERVLVDRARARRPRRAPRRRRRGRSARSARRRSSKRAPCLVAHALLRAARKNAYRTHVAPLALGRERDVVPVRRAALDAHADAASREAVEDRAARDGEIGIRAREDRRRRVATEARDRVR